MFSTFNVNFAEILYVFKMENQLAMPSLKFSSAKIFEIIKSKCGNLVWIKVEMGTKNKWKKLGIKNTTLHGDGRSAWNYRAIRACAIESHGKNHKEGFRLTVSVTSASVIRWANNVVAQSAFWPKLRTLTGRVPDDQHNRNAITFIKLGRVNCSIFT